jgi:hypothetical protein
MLFRPFLILGLDVVDEVTSPLRLTIQAESRASSTTLR